MLEVVVAGRRIEVELAESGGIARVDGRRIACDCVRLPGGGYSIIVDGRVYELSAELAGDVCHLTNGSDRYSVTIVDPRRLDAQTAGNEVRTGVVTLRADMPGKVVRVLVAPGDTVKNEQGLLVLEAMKMQNEIRSPRAGIVRHVAVAEGNTVASGDFLVSLE